jgi:hypothetical protein
MFRAHHNILESVLKAVGNFQTTELFVCFFAIFDSVYKLLALRDVKCYTRFSVVSSLIPALKSCRNTGKF